MKVWWVSRTPTACDGRSSLLATAKGEIAASQATASGEESLKARTGTTSGKYQHIWRVRDRTSSHALGHALKNAPTSSVA